MRLFCCRRPVLLLAAVGLLWSTGCARKSVRPPISETIETSPVAYDTLRDDRDGKTYRTTVIGGKRWMAENLNYEINNSWCYNDKPSNCKKYGMLYDWYMAMTICPAGWHLSTDKDWSDLTAATGGDSTDDTRIRAKTGWRKPPEGCSSDECPEWVPGTDEFGFSAMPGGYRTPDDDFNNAGYYGYWWVAPHGHCDNSCIKLQLIKYYNGESVERRTYSSNDKYSVRCVQNDGDGGGSLCDPADVPCPTDYVKERRESLGERIEKMSEYFTDSRDNKTYRAVKIGKKTWMAENLNYASKSGNSWCYLNNDCNCGAYGRLYDWNAANSSCPEGWHLPSGAEWDSLASAVGGEPEYSEDKNNVSWNYVNTKLRSESGWDTRFSVDWKDEYGFSALPLGRRNSNGAFNHTYSDGWGEWWTTAMSGIDSAYIRRVSYYRDYMDPDRIDKSEGVSVRCVRDD